MARWSSRLLLRVAVGIVLVTCVARGQTLPLGAFWKKAVVPVEIVITLPDGRDTVATVGTGLLVTDSASGKVFVVTCRHVIQDFPHALLRFHLMRTDSTVLVPIGFSGFKFVYPSDKKVDLAIAAIPTLKGVEYDFAAIDESFFLPADSVREGEDVYFLGYPLQIGGEHAKPVLRGGMVALIRESEYSFLIEGNAFPGNSGGPVFLKSSIFDYRTGTLGGSTRAYFIGVVQQYVAYEDIAFSRQTGKPRILFEENAALVRVIRSELVRGLMCSLSK